MMVTYKKIYVIIDTETGEFVAVNHRAAWTKPGNAKNAWNKAVSYSLKCLFDEQSRYILKVIE